MTAPPVVQRITKRFAWLEIVVVLLACYAPAAISQAIKDKALSNPAEPAYEFAATLTEIAILFYIVWLRDGDLKLFKLGRPKIFPDIGLGLAICFGFFFANVLMRMAIPRELYIHWSSMQKSAPIKDQVNMHLTLWSVLPPLFVVNSFEELLMRGYLTGRLLQLMNTKWAPVLISSVIFASWHIYEGPLGVMNAFIIGLILASIFTVSKRIWPLIIAHFSFDAILTLMYVAYLNYHRHR